jgi:hypothetical protein
MSNASDLNELFLVSSDNVPHVGQVGSIVGRDDVRVRWELYSMKVSSNRVGSCDQTRKIRLVVQVERSIEKSLQGEKRQAVGDRKGIVSDVRANHWCRRLRGVRHRSGIMLRILPRLVSVKMGRSRRSQGYADAFEMRVIAFELGHCLLQQQQVLVDREISVLGGNVGGSFEPLPRDLRGNAVANRVIATDDHIPSQLERRGLGLANKKLDGPLKAFLCEELAIEEPGAEPAIEPSDKSGESSRW